MNLSKYLLGYVGVSQIEELRIFDSTLEHDLVRGVHERKHEVVRARSDSQLELTSTGVFLRLGGEFDHLLEQLARWNVLQSGRESYIVGELDIGRLLHRQPIGLHFVFQ